jgi:hypothetical protein
LDLEILLPGLFSFVVGTIWGAIARRFVRPQWARVSLLVLVVVITLFAGIILAVADRVSITERSLDGPYLGMAFWLVFFLTGYFLPSLFRMARKPPDGS